MRFGCFVPQGWRLDLAGIEQRNQWPTILATAKAIEAAGYESLWVYDHFHTVPVPTQEATFEAWSLMSALAAATDTVRLGQMCTCVSYRPPAYLAKVAATIDVISGGRLEMGIGAGWFEKEYTAYGYDFPRAATRIAMLDEAVQIMRRLWTEDEVDFAGHHFVLDGAISQPKPAQDPHIPIWVAGGGEQLTLQVAARYADYTNFGSDIDDFIHKSKVLANHCERLNTDYRAIVRSSNFLVVCEDSEADVAKRLTWIKDQTAAFASEAIAVSRTRGFEDMAGTPDQLIERLQDWNAAGLDYGILYFAESAYDHEGLDRFGAEVMPALRSS